MFTINNPHQNAREEKGHKLFLEEQQKLQLQMSLRGGGGREALFFDAFWQTCSQSAFFPLLLSPVQHFFLPSVEVILDRLTRSSSPHVHDFVRRAEVKGSGNRKKGSESGEGGVKEKWREGVERGHPR